MRQYERVSNALAGGPIQPSSKETRGIRAILGTGKGRGNFSVSCVAAYSPGTPSA